MSRRGFTLPEITIALVILAIGVLIAMQTVATSSSAAQASDSKARAVRDADGLLRRLGHELSQSTTRIDPGLPPDEAQRLWILSDGIRFQRVVGYDLDPQGEALQHWSEPITYLWDPGARVVVRQVAGGQQRVMARNVTNFQAATSANGQVVLALEAAVGSEGRGTRVTHRRTIRVTPRNDLR